MNLTTALLNFVTLLMTTGSTAASAPPPSEPVHGTWPVTPPVISRGFEPPEAQWQAGHRGVDLRARLGAPVVASMAGTVSFVGVIGGRTVVVINHGPTRTTYEPVIARVHRGESVIAGQQIGTLDVTQSHCFPQACLHWGWRRGVEYLDPLLLVGHRKVRLLPVA